MQFQNYKSNTFTKNYSLEQNCLIVTAVFCLEIAGFAFKMWNLLVLLPNLCSQPSTQPPFKHYYCIRLYIYNKTIITINKNYF